MTPEDADKFKAQVEAMTWVQLVMMWKWLTLVIWQRMSQGVIHEQYTYNATQSIAVRR